VDVPLDVDGTGSLSESDPIISCPLPPPFLLLTDVVVFLLFEPLDAAAAVGALFLPFEGLGDPKTGS
jgi:hypothetical protein